MPDCGIGFMGSGFLLRVRCVPREVGLAQVVTELWPDVCHEISVRFCANLGSKCRHFHVRV